jgi:biopolymer transport protein ExbD
MWMVGACLLVGVFACDEERKPVVEADRPAATASSTAPSEPEPRRMPEVTLHSAGVNIGIDEMLLSTPSFDISFRSLLKKYPVDEPDTVIFNVDRKVKTPLATKIFYNLVDAGAKRIEIRTQPRGTFPDKLIIASEKDVGNDIPACTYVAMVLENFGATFWKKQGGTAKRYTKGMAGPDFSAMHEVMHREAKACNSKVFLFSAAPEIEWGHAFDTAGSVKAADPPYETISQFVLLRTDPVPGKPVVLDAPVK